MENDNLIETYERNGLTVKLFYDWDGGSDPSDWGNFKIVQFRDRDFGTYQDIEDYQTESGKLLPSVQSKLRAGKLFILDYYRYSNTDGGYYRLNGGLPSGVVDSQEVNGWIEFDDAYVKDISYADRRKYAEGDLKTYTEWANGEVYGWQVFTPQGDHLESCWGYIGDIEYAKTDANAAADSVRAASFARNARELHR